jgi:hypothetical protein
MLNLENFGPNICLSGGAIGADLQWGMCCGKAGFSVIHWSFKGHRSDAPSQEVFLLTPEQLETADEYCLKANEVLQRRYPPESKFVQNLLRRDYYQVAWSNAVYGVSNIKDGMVKGGTAWATTMFIQRFENKECPAYVFCQKADHWFQWKNAWVEIDSPPKPTGVVGCVGSRDLKENGKLAIRTLMNYIPAKID